MEGEVQSVLHSLIHAGIIIGALHTHWLFDRPRLMYIHVEAKMLPRDFAEAVADALNNKNKKHKTNHCHD